MWMTKPTPFLRPSPIRKTSALFGDSAEASRPGAGSSEVPPWLACAPGPESAMPLVSRKTGIHGNGPLQRAFDRTASRYRERPGLDSVSPRRRHIHASAGTPIAQELLKRDEISRVKDATERAARPQHSRCGHCAAPQPEDDFKLAIQQRDIRADHACPAFAPRSSSSYVLIASTCGRRFHILAVAETKFVKNVLFPQGCSCRLVLHLLLSALLIQSDTQLLRISHRRTRDLQTLDYPRTRPERASRSSLFPMSTDLPPSAPPLLSFAIYGSSSRMFGWSTA